MINILFCGNYKVFDGALTELISITNKTSEAVNCYIYTMDVSRINPDFISMSDEQIDFLNISSEGKLIYKESMENAKFISELNEKQKQEVERIVKNALDDENE